jgi:hypothetical protein
MRMAEQKFESLKCEWQSNFRSLVHANMVLVHQRLVFPFQKLCFFVSARVREILFDCFLHIWYERSGSNRSERDVEESPRRHTHRVIGAMRSGCPRRESVVSETGARRGRRPAQARTQRGAIRVPRESLRTSITWNAEHYEKDEKTRPWVYIVRVSVKRTSTRTVLTVLGDDAQPRAQAAFRS